MSRYTKEHYEDVARLIKGSWPIEAEGREAEEVVLFNLINKFADLFAEDDPPSVYCGYCGTTEGNPSPILCPERGLDKVHSFIYHKGFNRKQFLEACGLEPQSERSYSDYVAGKIAGEFE